MSLGLHQNLMCSAAWALCPWMISVKGAPVNTSTVKSSKPASTSGFKGQLNKINLTRWYYMSAIAPAVSPDKVI